MLRDELARVIGLLQQNPELGILVKGREIRRLLLPDTKQFVWIHGGDHNDAAPVDPDTYWTAVRAFVDALPHR